MIAKARLSLAEFLTLPDEKPYREYISGEAVPKPMPTRDHARIAGWLGHLWYLLAQRAGLSMESGPEFRITFPQQERSFLPDLYVQLMDPLTREPLGGRAFPELVVEVVSPDDRASRIADKVQVYLAADITTWVIDPENRTVTVFAPGADTIEYITGDEVPAAPVAPGFSIAVDEIFSVLPPQAS